MALFVLVVGGAGQVEVAHHVAGNLAGRVVAAMGGQVRWEPCQQVQQACGTLMAGRQHLEGLVETGRRCGVQRQGGSHAGGSGSGSSSCSVPLGTKVTPWCRR